MNKIELTDTGQVCNTRTLYKCVFKSVRVQTKTVHERMGDSVLIEHCPV